MCGLCRYPHFQVSTLAGSSVLSFAVDLNHLQLLDFLRYANSVSLNLL